MRLYKIDYFLEGNAVTAIVKEEGLGKAISILEEACDKHDNFTLISSKCLDNETGVLYRDYQD